MAAFFETALNEFRTPSFLEAVRRKFHYGEEQAPALREVAEEMLPLLRREAFWERRTAPAAYGQQSEGQNAIYENVVMSLGNGIDDLQESYSEKGLLSQSYMLEVLASELLLRGYEAYNCYVRENTDRHTARYHFPGSEEAFTLEMLPNLLKGLEGRISCNAAFCIKPKKSVVFIAELTQDESVQCEGICTGCHNTGCPNRMAEAHSGKEPPTAMPDMPMTYGYSRIFGKPAGGRQAADRKPQKTRAY